MTLNELRDEVTANAIAKGLDEPNPAVHIALMHSELSEALEDLREGKHPGELAFEPSGKPIGVPSEIADLIIRALHFCGRFEIDIDAAVRAKVSYNKTRPFKHGKKF